MAVAKRQGREKPMKIEQTKIKGRSDDRSEDLRQNKQHSWLAQFAQGSPRWREKTLKEEPKHSPPAPQPACVGSFSLSRLLACSSTLLFTPLSWHALTLQGWILLLSSK